MATNDEFNAAQEQMAAQIDALEAQKDALRQNHRPPTLLPHDFQVEYNNRYHTQVAGIQSQINAIQRQSRMMEGQLRRGAVEQNQAARVAEAQQKRQMALAKAADAQRKESLKETQKKLAGILGVKPDQVQDKLDNAVYDPVTHKLVVPTKSNAETRADIDARGVKKRAFDEKVRDGYAVEDLGTGKKMNVQPENIFGARPLPYKEADGKRVYTLNGKPYAIIPTEDFNGLKEDYDSLTSKPIDSGKIVSPDTFNAVRAQIGALGGDVPEDIVGQTQALVEQRRLAQPAIDNTRGFAPGLLPNERIVPATPVPVSNAPNSYPALTLPAVVGTNTPAMVDNSDLLQPNITARLPAKQLDIPQLGILPAATAQLPKQTVAVPFQQNALGNPNTYDPSLQSVMETRMPVFQPDYKTKNQLSRAAINQEVLNRGGEVSKEDFLAASDYADQLGIPQGDPRRGVVTKNFLDRRGAENQRATSDYNMVAAPVDAASRLSDAVVATNPLLRTSSAMGQVGTSLLPMGSGGLTLIPDKSAQRAELEKRFIDEQNNGVIGPNTNMDEYVNFFMRGPQPTNPVQLVP